ncbi:MAG: hypothetical protein WCN95_09775 [bacterium]
MIKQMTLRQLPIEVENGIRGRARSTGSSLNRVVIDLLEESLKIRPTDKKRRDLSRLAGQWSQAECAEFDRNTLIFGQIDEEIWKS